MMFIILLAIIMLSLGIQVIFCVKVDKRSRIINKNVNYKYLGSGYKVYSKLIKLVKYTRLLIDYNL